MSFGPSAALHPSHTLRCGPRPLTAAGGQGPLDNTAYGPWISTPYIKPALQSPSHTSSLPAIPFICGRLGMPGLGCNKQYCPSDLPLRSIPPTPAVWAPPAYGRGWPGSSGQHRLRPAYPLMHSQTCPEAPADAIHRNPSVLLHPLGCTCGSPLTDWRTIRNGRPAPSPLDLHGKQRAWKRPMYLSVESAQPLSRSVHMQNRGQTERPWRALCGISACSPLGEKASERGSNTFWGTFSVGGAAL